MITINSLPFPWEKGITLDDALKIAMKHPDLQKFLDKQLMYMINGTLVSATEKDKYILQDNDDIRIIFFVAGG